MKKIEMVNYIIDETRKVSKIKNGKKRERSLNMAKLHLIKSTDKQVEDLYEKVKAEGAENVFK